MAIVLVRFKVQDQAKWRPVFEGHADMRKNGGCSGAHIFFNADDPNDIFINFQWDSVDNFRKFVADPETQKAMAESGHVGPPEIWVLEDGGRTAS